MGESEGLQESLINLKTSERIREGERILVQELLGTTIHATGQEIVERTPQESVLKATISAIFIIFGGVAGGVISGLIVKNLSVNPLWVFPGIASGFTLGMLGAGALFFYRSTKGHNQEQHLELEILRGYAVLEKEDQEIAL